MNAETGDREDPAIDPPALTADSRQRRGADSDVPDATHEDGPLAEDRLDHDEAGSPGVSADTADEGDASVDAEADGGSRLQDGTCDGSASIEDETHAWHEDGSPSPSAADSYTGAGGKPSEAELNDAGDTRRVDEQSVDDGPLAEDRLEYEEPAEPVSTARAGASADAARTVRSTDTDPLPHEEFGLGDSHEAAEVGASDDGQRAGARVDPGLPAEDTADGNQVEQMEPDFENAEVDLSKLENYALNPDHPVGKNKYLRINAATGLEPQDAQAVSEQIVQGAREGNVVKGLADEYGDRWNVDIPLEGPTGTIMVRSAWIVEKNGTAPRLVTLSFPSRKDR